MTQEPGVERIWQLFRHRAVAEWFQDAELRKPLGEAEARETITYHIERRCWLLDVKEPRLEPNPSATCAVADDRIASGVSEYVPPAKFLGCSYSIAPHCTWVKFGPFQLTLLNWRKV